MPGKGKDKPKGKDKAAKAAKPAKQGMIRTRSAGFVGLLLLGVIAVMLLKKELDIQQAAIRAGAVLVALMVFERLLLPLARILIGPKQ